MQFSYLGTWMIIGVLGVAVASPCDASVGTPVPMDVMDATIVATIAPAGILPTPTENSVSGPLPLTLSYSLIVTNAGELCLGDGIATAELIGGNLRFHYEGSITGGIDCNISIRVSTTATVIEVPDVGDRSTLLLSTLELLSSAFVNIVPSPGSAGLGGPYVSSLLGGAVSGGLSANLSSSQLNHMLPSDTATFNSAGFAAAFERLTTSDGSFDETYELSIALPPQAQIAAVPLQVGWLVAGVLLGLGIKYGPLRGPKQAIL